MAKPKIKVSNKAMVDIMRSDEMLSEVTKRAEAIAAAANSEYTGTGEGFVVQSNVHSTRARAAVIAATNQAIYAEAKYGLLTKSMDAGRD
jgi:hypothetical protein